MRADGWERLPLIRMTNVSLLPGEQSLEEVFDVDHAIYMETNRSWSIDDKRYNFQFGCEIGWEMRHGKRVRMLKNPLGRLRPPRIMSVPCAGTPSSSNANVPRPGPCSRRASHTPR
jgi:predicted Zn-dependent protease